MEWNRPLRSVGTNVVKLIAVVIAIAAAGWIWNRVSLLVWHMLGSSAYCDDDFGSWYYRCISDAQFLNVFSWDAWERNGFMARFMSLIALVVASFVLWVVAIRPFVDEYRRSTGDFSNEAGDEEASTEPVFCQNQFCDCVEHKGGTLPYPADVWDPQAARWIISSSPCTNPNCTCTDYHEGQEFDHTAGFWVRKDS